MSEAALFRQLGIILALVAVVGGLAGCQEETIAGKPVNSLPAFGPTLILRVSAPGFSSETLAEVIAAPIEGQLAALENLLIIESLSTEGRVEFQLHTKAGCNLKQVESLVANRIAAIKDSLPQAVTDSGLEIQAKTMPVFAVAVFSPDKKQDHTFLCNYVKTNIQNQLAHVPGIGQIKVCGNSAAGNEVLIKQQPGIALLLSPTVDAKPTDVAVELKQRLDELRRELPEGIVLTLPINLAESIDPREACLLLELQHGEGTDSSTRNLELSNANIRLRELQGIKSWISFAQHPIEAGNPYPCILVHATTDQPEQAPLKIREGITELMTLNAGTKLKLRNFGKPDDSSVVAAISGPDVQAADELANHFAAKLEASHNYRITHSHSPRMNKPRVTVKLDRSKMAAHGLTSAEIVAALETCLGQPPHADAASDQVHLPELPEATSLLAQCHIKNAAGNELPLSSLALTELASAKLAVYRVNNQPAVLLTAQTSGGQALKDARDQIGSLFAAARNSMTLGDEYKLIWIEE